MSEEPKPNDDNDLVIRRPDIIIEGKQPEVLPTEEGEKRLPSVKDLSPLQRQYIAYLNNGRNDQESAELLGVDPKTLYNWRQKPLFCFFWNESRKTINEKMQGLKPKALERLGRLIDNEDERIALTACLAILKTDLETRRGGNKDEVEDIINEIERETNASERLELAKKIRASLDTRGADKPIAAPGAEEADSGA